MNGDTEILLDLILFAAACTLAVYFIGIAISKAKRPDQSIRDILIDLHRPDNSLNLPKISKITNPTSSVVLYCVSFLCLLISAWMADFRWMQIGIVASAAAFYMAIRPVIARLIIVLPISGWALAYVPCVLFVIVIAAFLMQPIDALGDLFSAFSASLPYLLFALAAIDLGIHIERARMEERKAGFKKDEYHKLTPGMRRYLANLSQ